MGPDPSDSPLPRSLPLCGSAMPWFSSPLEMRLPQPPGVWRGSDLCVFSGLRPSDLQEGEVVQHGPRATPALFIFARGSGMRGCGAAGGSRGDETQGTGSSRRRGCWTDQRPMSPQLKRLLPLFSVTAIHPWRSFSPCKTAVECSEAPVNLLLPCCSWG